MEIADEHYSWNSKISWITKDPPPEIIPGVDYWFSYKGHMLNNGINILCISSKLANKICDATSLYRYDIIIPQLKHININGTVFEMFFEKMYGYRAEDPEYYVLRGSSNYLTVNIYHYSKAGRKQREKTQVKIEVYNQFINKLNSII